MSAGILANPLMQMFLTQLGGEALSRFMPGQNSPYQQAVGQQIQYGQRMMPELYSQAMGQPSAATRQQYKNLSAEANRLQQSYAASAQRGTPTMREPTTPVREQQGRFQEAKLGAYGDILAQGQQSAQNALLGMYGRAMPQQQALEMQQRLDRQNMFKGLTGILGEYKNLKNDQQARDMFEPLLRRLMMLLGGGMGAQGGVGTTSAAQPMQGWQPTGNERFL